MKIATWNVNSVKARLPNVLEWINTAKPDILMLQELKCQTDAFPAMEFEWQGYNLAIHGQKTYNGVAILSKYPLEDITTSFTDDPDPAQSRYIEAVASTPHGVMRVASVYVPNGGEVNSDKFQYKLKFFEALRKHCAQRLSWEEPYVLGGDFNVAPEALDVHNAPALKGSTCFHPEEQLRFRALEELGLTDTFRAAHPHEQAYSWWDYRAGAWQKNEGMRIDMLMLSPEAADIAKESGMDSATRAQDKASDHIPVWCTFG